MKWYKIWLIFIALAIIATLTVLLALSWSTFWPLLVAVGAVAFCIVTGCAIGAAITENL